MSNSEQVKNKNLDYLTSMSSKPRESNTIEIVNTNFRNEDYILKLNTMQMLKFFKDELTIKYIGKGYNSIDYAVRIKIDL